MSNYKRNKVVQTLIFLGEKDSDDYFITKSYKSEDELVINNFLFAIESIVMSNQLNDSIKRKLTKHYNNDHKKFFIEVKKIIDKIIEDYDEMVD